MGFFFFQDSYKLIQMKLQGQSLPPTLEVIVLESPQHLVLYISIYLHHYL